MNPRQLTQLIEFAERERDDVRRELSDVERRIESFEQDRRASMTRRAAAAHDVTPLQQEQYLAWCRALIAQEQGIARDIAQAQAQAEQLQQVVMSHHRRVRSLEFLHRRALARVATEQQRRQQHMGDELAVRRWLEAAS